MQRIKHMTESNDTLEEGEQDLRRRATRALVSHLVSDRPSRPS